MLTPVSRNAPEAAKNDPAVDGSSTGPTIDRSNILETMRAHHATLKTQQEQFRNDTLKTAEDRQRGAESNLNNTKKELAKNGTGFAWLSGTTAVLQKQLDADKAMLEARQKVTGKLNSSFQESEKLIKEYDKKIGKIQEILESKELNDNQKVDQINTLIKSADEIVKKTVTTLQENQVALDTSQYSKKLNEVNADLNKAIAVLDKCETVCQTAHTIGVVATATAVTVATGGAGAGIAASMIAGTAAGTAVGAGGNLIEAGGHIALGNKTTSEAFVDAGYKTIADAKSAATAAATAAGGTAIAQGVGVAAKAAGATGNTLKLAQASGQYIAPGAVQLGNSTVEVAGKSWTVANEWKQHQESAQFKAEHATKAPHEIAQIREKFFEERGLSWGQIGKDLTIDVAAATVGGVVGARFGNVAGAPLKKQAVAAGKAFASDVGIGAVAGYMKTGDLSVDSVFAEAQNVVVGNIVGAASKAKGRGLTSNPDQDFNSQPKQTLNDKLIGSLVKVGNGVVSTSTAVVVSGVKKITPKTPSGDGAGLEAPPSVAKSDTKVDPNKVEQETQESDVVQPQSTEGAAPATPVVDKTAVPEIAEVQSVIEENRESGKVLTLRVGNQAELKQAREILNKLSPEDRKLVEIKASKDLIGEIKKEASTPRTDNEPRWRVKEATRIEASAESPVSIADVKKVLDASPNSKVTLAVKDVAAWKNISKDILSGDMSNELGGRLNLRFSKEIALEIKAETELLIQKQDALIATQKENKKIGQALSKNGGEDVYSQKADIEIEKANTEIARLQKIVADVKQVESIRIKNEEIVSTAKSAGITIDLNSPLPLTKEKLARDIISVAASKPDSDTIKNLQSLLKSTEVQQEFNGLLHRHLVKNPQDAQKCFQIVEMLGEKKDFYGLLKNNIEAFGKKVAAEQNDEIRQELERKFVEYRTKLAQVAELNDKKDQMTSLFKRSQKSDVASSTAPEQPQAVRASNVFESLGNVFKKYRLL